MQKSDTKVTQIRSIHIGRPIGMNQLEWICSCRVCPLCGSVSVSWLVFSASCPQLLRAAELTYRVAHSVWPLTFRWFDSLHPQPREEFCRLSRECSAKKITPLNTPVPRRAGFLMLKGTKRHQDCHKGVKLNQEPCNPKPLQPPKRNLAWVGYYYYYFFF